jgi:murein DD-endopeptidase MepM/ murein hydrolase activator NlpD
MVLSMTKGRVFASGSQQEYGNYVMIKTPKGNYIIYAHLKKPSDLKPNDIVKVSTLIGQMGSTGKSTGPHLHIEMLVGGPRSITVIQPFGLGFFITPSSY